jgi:hypothetical protein
MISLPSQKHIMDIKRFIKALIVGYIAIWSLDYVKQLFKGENIQNLDDLKRLLKEKL